MGFLPFRCRGSSRPFQLQLLRSTDPAVVSSQSQQQESQSEDVLLHHHNYNNRRSPRHSAFCEKASDSQHKPLPVHSCLPALLGDVVVPRNHQQQQGGLVSSPFYGGGDDDDEQLLQTLCEKGQLEPALDVLSRMHTSPSDNTYMSLLQACIKSKGSTQAKRVHAHLALHRTTLTNLLGDYLVMTLAKCGSIEDALQISATLPRRTVFSWSAIISAYAECGCGHEALQSYQCMLKDSVEPNHFTFVSLFKACGSIPNLAQGKKFHAEARKRGFTSNLFVCNTLMSMYGKCGAIVEAQEMFSALPQCSIVSWTAMLSAYVEQGQGERALQLYRQMQEEGMRPDRPTFSMALVACRMLAEKEEGLVVMGRSTKVMSLEIGRALHADARKRGCASDVFFQTTLVRMYGKCGAVAEAENAFNVQARRDLISWTAMLSAYVQQSEGEKALQLYKKMRMEHVALDDVTVIYILQACSERGSLAVCKQVHFDIVSAGFDMIPSMASTLVHTYGNCSSMVDAHAIFDKHPEPDVVAWNACIAGHVGEGNTAASLHLFEKLKRGSIKPDEVTFILVLSACSHAGLVLKGLEYFESMNKQHSLTPDLKHYNIIVDLLGRAGDFQSVENMLGSMPMQADLIIWLCVLCACRTHGNLELAKQAFDHAVNLQPKQAFAYVMMSNVYADAGLHKLAVEVEKLRQNAVEVDNSKQGESVWRKCSRSWIEVEQELHSYVIGGDKHPQEKQVHQLLYQMGKELKDKMSFLTDKG